MVQILVGLGRGRQHAAAPGGGAGHPAIVGVVEDGGTDPVGRVAAAVCAREQAVAVAAIPPASGHAGNRAGAKVPNGLAAAGIEDLEAQGQSLPRDARGACTDLCHSHKRISDRRARVGRAEHHHPAHPRPVAAHLAEAAPGHQPAHAVRDDIDIHQPSAGIRLHPALQPCPGSAHGAGAVEHTVADGNHPRAGKLRDEMRVHAAPVVERVLRAADGAQAPHEQHHRPVVAGEVRRPAAAGAGAEEAQVERESARHRGHAAGHRRATERPHRCQHQNCR